MTSRLDLDLFEELVMALGNRESRGVRLTTFTPEFAQFALPDGSALVVLRHLRGDADRLKRMVLRVCEGLKQGTLYLVAAGGDEASHDILENGRPVARMNRRVRVFAVDDTRTVWFGSRCRPTRDLDAALDAVRRPLERSPAEFDDWLQEQLQAAKELRQRVETYNKAMLTRRPRATQALLVVMLAIYGLEWLWGGARSVPSLVRMGALVNEGEMQGQAWRLLSYSFLHLGTWHLLLNGVILALGGWFLERLLGTWRLVLLWTLSVLGGGLAYLLFPSSAQVVGGASGGCFGLATGALVLALRPRGLIPDALAYSLRRIIGQLLVLCLIASFQPGVALSVHIGGGLVGALVMLTGLGTLGLASAHRAAEGRAERGPAIAARAAGLLCGGAVLVSLCLAMVQGQPWMLRGEPDWSRRNLGVENISLELPGYLEQKQLDKLPSGTTLLKFGTLLTAPLTVEIEVIPIRGPMGTPSKSPIRLWREFEKIKTRHLDTRLEGGATTRQGKPKEHEYELMFRLDEVLLREHESRSSIMWRHSRVVPSATLVVSISAYRRDEQLLTPWKSRIIESLRTGYEPVEVPSD